jgi:hypothetical protein
MKGGRLGGACWRSLRSTALWHCPATRFDSGDLPGMAHASRNFESRVPDVYQAVFTCAT